MFSYMWMSPTVFGTRIKDNLTLHFQIDLFMHPIFSETGNFPSLVREIVDRKSKEQGFTSSRLPTLTAEEIKLIRGMFVLSC